MRMTLGDGFDLASLALDAWLFGVSNWKWVLALVVVVGGIVLFTAVL
jgi:hypothetical protein